MQSACGRKGSMSIFRSKTMDAGFKKSGKPGNLGLE